MLRFVTSARKLAPERTRSRSAPKCKAVAVSPGSRKVPVVLDGVRFVRRSGGAVEWCSDPRVRSHAHKMNKKVRRQALCSALSRRAEEKGLAVLESMVMDEPKTRHMVAFMRRFELSDMLLVTAESDVNIERCASNLSNVTVLPSAGVNVYDVLLRSNLVMTQLLLRR